MSKKQITRIRKFLRSDVTPLTSEAIDEIKSASKNIPNAERIMCKKHRIGTSRYKDIINNRIPLEPTNEWRKIINSVCIELSLYPVTPLPSLEVEQVNEVKQAKQVVNEWQACSGQEAALPLVLSAKGAPSGAEEAETASEASTTFSDVSSVSSYKIIPLKKLLHMGQKRKTKAGDSTPSHMTRKNEIEEDELLILESDFSKMVNRCKKIVGNGAQKTC